MATAALTVDLNARIAKFETDMKRATGTLDRFGKSASVLKAGFTGLFAGVGIAGIATFAKNGIDAADALKDMSDRLGVSVKDLASFKLAAEQSGTELEGVGKGIARLTRSIGEAEGGNAKLGEALKALGISARDPKEAFFQLADATEKIQDPAKRAALLSQVLGKSYQDLIPFLSQGSAELRKLAQESESFAQTMARLAPDADKFNDELARLKQEAATAAGGILTHLVPALTKLIESYQNLNRLGKAGANFDDIFFGNVSGDIAKTIKSANEDIKSLEGRIAFSKKLGVLGDSSPLEKELARVKSIRDEARKISFEGAMRIADDQYKKPPKNTTGVIDTSATECIAGGGKWDGKKCVAKKTSSGVGSKADPQGDFVKKLREEAATLGLTGEALQRYEALKLKLTGSNAKLADSYITQIAAFKSQQEAAKANNEAFDEAIRKQDELDATLERSIKSVREWIIEQEFEVSLIGLTNNERATAIQLRELETAGIDTQTEAYKNLAKQIEDAQLRKRGMSLLSGTQTEKTKEFMADIEAIDKLFFEGSIGAAQFAEGIEMITGSTEKAKVELDDFAQNAAKNIQQSMADFLFDPFKDGLDGMLLGFGKMLQRMIAEAVAADLAKRMFGGLSDGGKTGGSGWIGGALELFGGLFGSGSANGNAFSASGAKLHGFANGGVVSGPASGYPVLMHGTEGVLPLKRGANGKLGVENFGGGGNITVIVNGSNNAPDVRRAAAQGAREAMGMLSAAKRYA